MAKMAKSPDAAKRRYERGAAKKAAAPKSVKVSQGTIDKIKGMGMTAALKRAGSSKNAEFVEGVKRMYGARRLTAAQGKSASKRIQKPSLSQPAAKSSDAARDKYLGRGPNKVNMTKKAVYTSKKPKPMNPKGLFPGLLGGKK